MKTIHCTVQRTIVLPVETYDFAGKAGEVMGYRLNNRPFAPRELRVGGVLVRSGRQVSQIQATLNTCSNGGRVLLVMMNQTSRNHILALLCKEAGTRQVHQWKKDKLLNFKIVGNETRTSLLRTGV